MFTNCRLSATGIKFLIFALMAEETANSGTIVNKVASSALIQLDLEEYYPKEEIVVFDIKPHLFMELILKEKDFREALQQLDWSVYQDKLVAVTCTADAIIPSWAYMLIASYLQPIAGNFFFGDERAVRDGLFLNNLRKIDVQQFADQRVVVKGCGDIQIGDFAFLEITKLLRPVAKTIMYGEPCSTVPVFKKKN